jgi:hypothetical protein
MDVGLLKNIILVLMGLCVIWVVRVLVRRETENIVRATLFLIFLGVAFYYLQHTELERLTWGDFKGQVKDTFFPEKMPSYVYEKNESGSPARTVVVYSFQVPAPRLSLSIDSDRKYFHIRDIRPINRTLEYLGLPKVKTAVRELASITGSQRDINLYRWNDYPLGVLTIERGICQERNRLESYQCILKITIGQR